MHSLRARLLAASLAVALLAVGITAWAVNRTTSAQVRDAIESDFEIEELIYGELSFFAFATGSWDEVVDVVGELAAHYEQRIALTTVDGVLIADSAPGAELPDAPDRFIDPTSPVISFEGLPGEVGVGYGDQFGDLIVVLENAGVPFEVEEEFGLAYPVWDPEDPLAGEVVGQFLVEEFMGGTAALAETGVLEPEELALLLDEAGIPYEEAVGPDGETFIAWDPFDPSLHELVMVGGSGFTNFDAFPFPGASAEPALLFLGLADQDGALPDPIGWQLLLIVALVAAAAVLATVLVSRRVLGPVGALTAAAKRMEQGDLGERVPVSGSDEIADLAGAFNAMAGSLQEQDRLRKTMTSDVAHELRTPLSNIRGYLEALEEGVVEPTPATIRSLHEEAVLLQGLIDELQDLSLAESGALRIDPAPTDLADLIQRSVLAHEVAAEAAGVRLSVKADVEVTLSVDAGRMRQVIGNLVHNAVRHTPSGGTVEVGLVVGDEQVDVVVTDTGIGIPAEHLPHVFDRFYRVDSSRSRDTGGTGLGLAIAAEVVRLHDGTIGVTSEAGRGSVFTVTLPR